MRIFTPQHGFTLTEMAVTVAVLAILAALAVPSFQSLLNKKRVSGAAEQFYTDLQYARSEAIKRDTNVFISFRPGSASAAVSWCYGISITTNCDCNTPGVCLLDGVEKVVNQQGFNGVTLTHPYLTDISFRPRRGDVRSNSDAAVGNGTISFAVNDNGTNRTVSIVIGNLVRTRICSPRLSGSSSPISVSGYPAC